MNEGIEMRLKDALTGRRSVRAFDKQPVPKDSLDRLIWATQGITDDSGNRCAPSAHALHPLRLMLIAGEIEGLATGLYSVDPKTATLQSIHDRDIRPALKAAAVDDQTWITDAAIVITICADMVTASQSFADQQPYGTRGPRYVFIEAGAAAQNTMLQAVAEGLGSVLVAGFRDEATADALGLEAPLAPILHICIGYPKEGHN